MHSLRSLTFLLKYNVATMIDVCETLLRSIIPEQIKWKQHYKNHGI